MHQKEEKSKYVEFANENKHASCTAKLILNFKVSHRKSYVGRIILYIVYFIYSFNKFVGERRESS